MTTFVTRWGWVGTCKLVSDDFVSSKGHMLHVLDKYSVQLLEIYSSAR